MNSLFVDQYVRDHIETLISEANQARMARQGRTKRRRTRR